MIHSYEDAGRTVIATARKISLGWILVVQQDADEVFSAVDEADRYALVTVGITIAVVLVLAFVLAGRLTRPIVSLTSAADSMSRGVFDETIAETDRNDEIGALARSIERMGMSIKVAVHRMRTQSRG